MTSFDKPPDDVAVMARCRVLLVDDDEDDYLITRDMLDGQQRVRFQVDWNSTYDEALSAICAAAHDVYLIDYRLGSRTGLELVREAFASGPHAPVILLTGHDDYEIDLEATALGVTDYVTKQGLDATGLERAIRYALSHHAALNDLARSEERYALAASAANDGIWDWDVGAGTIYRSPRWHAILGRPENSDQHHPDGWLDLVHDEDRPRVTAAIQAHLDGRTPHLHVEHRMRHIDGSWRWVLNRGLAIRDPRGTPTRMAGSMADISERRAAELQLQHNALHDPLTGLPNRALVMDRLQQSLERSLRDGSAGCAVLFLDIDRFKLVNDSLSHGIGDQLLVALAGRFVEAVEPGDTVARIGGDEFTFLLDRVTDQHEAKGVAERICEAVAHPTNVAGHELFVTASIGIALGSGLITPADLLRNADIAMYDAKQRGGGRYAVFDQSMHRRVVDRVARENELRQVVEQSLIAVHYQPIVDLATGRIRGLEALARWPEGWPEISPLEFIPIAEESGLIRELGLQVLRSALLDLAAWRRSGLIGEDVGLNVNISKRQLDDPRLPEQILDALAGAQLPGDSLRLEITETTLMQEPDRIQRIISEVCANGVGLHLDDFGTGYSSLAALRQFPVSALKIDRSFVTSLVGHDGDSETIVRSTIALAHSLGLEAIAEGVEHEVELERLRALGCEGGQGFLFSRPLGEADTRSLLANWSRTRAA